MDSSDRKTATPHAALAHAVRAHAVLDGGDLDCGSGLLLLIRKRIDPLETGQILEIQSSEPSVAEDLPAWCRMTGNELLTTARDGRRFRFHVSKGPRPPLESIQVLERQPAAEQLPAVEQRAPAAAARHRIESASGSVSGPVPTIKPLSVMGIGSWPRPRWMLQAIHERLEGRLDEREFQRTADDAVRLAVRSQLDCGVDVVTDGEQRRDSYASFVGGLLDNCQLIPLTDLAPYVDDPFEFAAELRALDVPADQVRHPAVLGPIARGRPLATRELRFARTLTDRPIKVALPGPYLLTRTMWLECVSDRAYETRESLADDLVRVLREELLELLAEGAALVQFDEPVLSEVVYGEPSQKRVFMCGALAEKRSIAEELAFAEELLRRVTDGVDPDRLALHICRGNWTRDESVALRGGYEPLIPLLATTPVGTVFLECCTPRAGEIEALAGLPERLRLGIGVVNQKLDSVETVEAIVRRAESAIDLFGAQRVLLNPDCGFATFADNPVASAEIASAKLSAIVQAASLLKKRHLNEDR